MKMLFETTSLLTQTLRSPSGPFPVVGARPLRVAVGQTVIQITGVPGDRSERGPVPVFQHDRTVPDAVQRSAVNVYINTK